jgi:alkane 1-monooxygenase
MHVRSLKYLTPLIIYTCSFQAFIYRGWSIFLPLLLAWMLVPLLELLIKPDNSNLGKAEEELVRSDRLYDFWLYIIVPLQYAALYLFLASIQEPGLKTWEVTGRIFVMGLLCGTFGINVAHELGHRHKAFEQMLAKTLLLTSMYMHFFIEHNKGHHQRVSTPEDPSSARYGENLYAFFVRTIIFSWLSAWKIAAKEMHKKGLPAIHWKNEMLQFQYVQLLFACFIGYAFGWKILFCFLAAATIGFLLLETVNYIEHYGLQRRRTGPNRYERTMPVHSWNSNHVLGRVLLFELSRHSDHHYLASRKYQVLRHHEAAPQMPTGYPGMMILSLFPPAWFLVMNPRVRQIAATGQEGPEGMQPDNNLSKP